MRKIFAVVLVNIALIFTLSCSEDDNGTNNNNNNDGEIKLVGTWNLIAFEVFLNDSMSNGQLQNVESLGDKITFKEDSTFSGIIYDWMGKKVEGEGRYYTRNDTLIFDYNGTAEKANNNSFTMTESDGEIHLKSKNKQYQDYKRRVEIICKK